MQIGNGVYIPSHQNIKMESYTFKKSLCDDIRSSDLVISHAGVLSPTCMFFFVAFASVTYYG